MGDIYEEIEKLKVVPVVVLDDDRDAVDLAKALIEGGLPCAEVTFRTKAAKGAIEKMLKAYPDMLVGAGTVLTTSQVDEALDAGAKFIVSPGLNEDVVKYCFAKNVPVFPGVVTPSEIDKARALGLTVVKFFPAEAAGGLKMLKAMSAPYSDMRFMPTGGISADNISDYLSFDKIIACGGSWMVKKDYIKNGDFEKIKELTMEAVKLSNSTAC